MPRGRGRGFEFREGHDGALFWVTRMGFLIVLLALLALATVWLVQNMRKPVAVIAAAPTAPSAALIPSPSGTDEAIAHLRMRYARGEIGRDEYLRTASDLGVLLPPDTPTV